MSDPVRSFDKAQAGTAPDPGFDPGEAVLSTPEAPPDA